MDRYSEQRRPNIGRWTGSLIFYTETKAAPNSPQAHFNHCSFLLLTFSMAVPSKNSAMGLRNSPGWSGQKAWSRPPDTFGRSVAKKGGIFYKKYCHVHDKYCQTVINDGCSKTKRLTSRSGFLYHRTTSSLHGDMLIFGRIFLKF